MFDTSKEFLACFKAGKEAARQGNREQAHRLFRQAIEIDPYHEQVWLWLASVVEDDSDRRVCFENVLEINPSNPTARRQLMLLEEQASVAVLTSEPPRARQRRWRWPLRLLATLLGVAAGVGGAIALDLV